MKSEGEVTGLMNVGGIEGDHLMLGYRRQQGRSVGGYLGVGLDDNCRWEIRSHSVVVFNDIINGRGCFDDDLGCCLGDVGVGVKDQGSSKARWLCVHEDSSIREVVLTEVRSSPFSIHPDSTKMYRDLKQNFWWNDIPTWKWDQISMDFVTGLPRTFKKNDTICVVVNRLTKSTYFLTIQQGHLVSNLAEIFQQDIIQLHGNDYSEKGQKQSKTDKTEHGMEKA
ncbi:retrotransposon protein, putative, ty3-gypsy subclass [Tanacetum coccineum]